MQASAEKIWGAAQEQLRAMLSADIHNLWFAPIRVHGMVEGQLVLEVADDFCEVWLTENYLSIIEEVLAQVAGHPVEVKFKVCLSPAPAGGSAAPASTKGRVEEISRKPAVIHEQVCNPKSTFETFVVGANNNFSYGAALAVARDPGKVYNPLFLFGGVGLGKTHLLHAIGNYVAGARKGARIAYVSSERFTNEYIDGIQNNTLPKFRKRYRQMDVLLIDDIQFLAGKEGIQEEFFHTFNALHEAHKQIVLTCDRPASEVANLENRLVSRFEWGLTTDLQPPDVEMRLAILKKKAAGMNVQLPDEIVEFLANRIRTNIRRLEGALNRVASFASLTGRKLTLDAVENLLRDILHEEGRSAISIEHIQKKVAERFDIRLADMTSRRRPENIAFPRQIAMYLSRNMTEASLNVIGEAFGGRDHGTVLHACRIVKGRMEVDAEVRQTVNNLERQLAR